MKVNFQVLRTGQRSPKGARIRAHTGRSHFQRAVVLRKVERRRGQSAPAAGWAWTEPKCCSWKLGRCVPTRPPSPEIGEARFHGVATQKSGDSYRGAASGWLAALQMFYPRTQVIFPGERLTESFDAGVGAPRMLGSQAD